MAHPDRDYRLRSSLRISAVFDTGLRAQDGRALMVGAASATEVPRMAFAVGKRHGHAVRRNRLRRLCREAFRQVRAELPGGWDFVLVPRVRDDHSVGALAASIRLLALRIAQAAGAARQDARP